MNRKMEHPWIAFAVIVTVSAVLSNYGIVDGSLLLFDLFAGIAVYRFVTSPSH